jgi:hypothetical protein
MPASADGASLVSREAVGLWLKYGDFIAWPVVLFKRPLC